MTTIQKSNIPYFKKHTEAEAMFQQLLIKGLNIYYFIQWFSSYNT